MRLTIRLVPAGILLLLSVATANVSAQTTKPIPRSPRTGERSVKPGINDDVKTGDVDKWVKMFEADGRWIYRERERIINHIRIKPGMVIADIGAGTGFFTVMLARKVQPSGRVYAVEIVPEFVELIRTRAKEQELGNIEAVLCSEDSVKLPPASIDLAFVCDTYHHFEYPRSTMGSIHKALKPGGEVVVVDFIRDKRTSRPWVLSHVRADQDNVIREIESDGFELIERGDRIPYLIENYIMRLRKKE
ncbi:MAG: class I SAM-dependent methyltransferase [Planctomycetota bacterium]|jgi:SAM-dependent methyltransferase